MRWAALLLLFTNLALAQSPWDGWIAVSSFKVNGLPSTTSSFPGNGGLWMLHPRTANQAPTQLLNLPASMTGSGSTATRIGTNSVAWMAPCPLYPEGALLAGEISPVATGNTVRLHLLMLTGISGSNIDQPIVLGNAVGNGSVTPFGSVDQIVVIPDSLAGGTGQRALFAVRGVTSTTPGGFSAAGSPIGLFLEYAPYVTPFPLASIPGGAINALTAKRDGTTAYFAMINNPGAGQTRIYSVPVAAIPAALPLPAPPPTPPATPQLLATLPHYVMSLTVRNNGDLVAGLLGGAGTPVAQNIAIINATSGAVSYLSGPAVARNAVALEPFTGTLFLERETYGPLAVEVVHRAADGTETLLSTGPSAGWGVVSGIAPFNNPNVTESDTTAGSYAGFGIDWDLHHAVPGTYKLPIGGTTGFSLGAVGAGAFPTDGIGMMWFHQTALAPSVSLAVPPFGNVLMHVDLLAPALIMGDFFSLSAASPRFAQPLGSIPAALIGARLYGQFAYVTTAGNTLWLSSRLNFIVL